jgi:hypothetical protein
MAVVGAGVGLWVSLWVSLTHKVGVLQRGEDMFRTQHCPKVPQ